MSNLLILLMMILSTFRLTWLITRDEFPPIRWVREQIQNQHTKTSYTVAVSKLGEEKHTEFRGPWEWASDLVTCHWCMSVWVAAGMTLSVWLTMPSMPLPLLWFGSTAAGSVILASAISRVEDRG